jgi:hypothetical protein
LLKDKIASVEERIKGEKKAVIVQYFNELCASEKIDFISFDRTGIEILLSTTEKAYKEKCNEFVSKVLEDVALIASTDFEAEALVEYKKTLNVSQSIITVKNRKAAEKAEQERINSTPAPQPAPAPIAPPVMSAPVVEELVCASFTVTCTQSKLTALGAYMRENNITYKNV